MDNLMLAIDANSLLHRAYHAYPISLTTTDGQPINAVYGFTSMLLEVLVRYKPTYVVVAFDTKAPTFRHKKYTGYKAKRPQTDSELIQQVNRTKEVLTALNIPIFEKQGFEADDILGTLVSQIKEKYRRQVERVYLLTGDKDMFQLVDQDFVKVLLPKGSFKNLEEYGYEEVFQKLGVTPEQVVDLKALMGDPSDNIPGVKGIGPKTAVNLLSAYKSLENIFKNLSKIAEDNSRVAKLLENGHEDAILSKQLARIKKDVPLVFDLSATILKEFDYSKAYELFVHFQFKSLLPRLKQLAESIGVSVSTTDGVFKLDFSTEAFRKKIQDIYMFIKSKNLCNSSLPFDDLYEKINSLKPQKIENISKVLEVLLDVSSDSEDVLKYAIFYINGSKIFFANIEGLQVEVKGGAKILFWNWWQFVQDVAYKNDEKLNKMFANLNFALFDPILVGYGLSAGRRDLGFSDLVAGFLDIPIADVNNISNAEKLKLLIFLMFAQLEKAEEIYEYGKDFLYLVNQVDPWAVFGIALMQASGVTIDLNKVKEYDKTLKHQLKDIEAQIYDSVGFEFNIRSVKQLGSVLFETLKLPKGRKTKTGYSTGVEILESLRGAHPVVDLLLEYRKLQKIHSTYVKPFLALNNGDATEEQGTLLSTSTPQLKRIYSQFDPIRTSTGRLASHNPNLQNLPIRTDEGKKVREFFVPQPGYVFISFDYSQIDLRVLAHLSEDPALIQAFKQGRDIHRETASKIFGKKYDEITDQERRIAKTINFGLVYGMGVHGLATRLGIDMSTAREFIEEYFKHFKGVKEYIEKNKEFVMAHHFVLSLLGRRRYIHGVASSNRNRQAAALREAVNMPIQGGSDDVIRSAIAKISHLPEILEGKVRLVLQIHDELVFEVPEDKKIVDDWIDKVKGLMENAVKLKVPLKVGYEVMKDLGK